MPAYRTCRGSYLGLSVVTSHKAELSHVLGVRFFHIVQNYADVGACGRREAAEWAASAWPCNDRE
jgi:hypothetical protein